MKCIVLTLTLALALVSCGKDDTTVVAPERGTVSTSGKKVQGPTIVGMANWPVLFSAIAIDSEGGVYLGQTGQWERVATTPSKPADIWFRPSSGEVFIVLLNGELWRLEGPGGTPPSSTWRLTFDSDIFGQ